MTEKKLLELIGKISPNARNYVHDELKNGNVETIYSDYSEQNQGVFIKVENEDCCIFFACFLNDNFIDSSLKLIEEKTGKYISNKYAKEICFNVYGKNREIIDLVKSMGFITDSEGHFLEYMGKAEITDSDLMEKYYNSNMIDEFANLFDSTYYQLCLDNGYEVDGYSKYKDGFDKTLQLYSENNQLSSFWNERELVGAYIFKGNFIMDIVIKPEYQCRGYGSYLLSHCVNRMIEKNTKRIMLKVLKTNHRAKKLYERKGFREISFFAEHTYSPK